MKASFGSFVQVPAASAGAEKEGWYESKFATLLHIQDGRITYAKDHFDPAGFIKRSASNCQSSATMQRVLSNSRKEQKPSQAPCTEEDLKRQIERTLDFLFIRTTGIGGEGSLNRRFCP